MTVLRISVVLLCVTSASCAPQDSPAPTLTPVQAPAVVARLDDPSSRLSEEQRGMLYGQLERIARATRSSIGVVIAPAINGENIDNVAHKTFSAWHLGENGVLIVLGLAEHRSRIETGHGIESVLTDDLCTKILREHVRGHLAQGDVYGALSEGLEAIGSILQERGDAGTEPQRVGRTFSNGNCACDSNKKLTGLCVGSDGTGKACVEHAPDPDSPPCKAGLTPSEIRVAPCSTDGPPVMASREHQCFWLHE